MKRVFFAFLITFVILALISCQQKTNNNVQNQAFYKAVNFKTKDGLILAGKIHGRGSTGVILSHMYPADQESWKELALFLSRKGLTVMTYNFRGYLPSQGQRRIEVIDRDLLAAVNFLKPKVKKLYLVGASMGGTASLKVLNKENLKINGIITISSPPEFLGLKVGQKWAKKPIPKLFLASAKDGQAAEFARQFYAQAVEPKEMEIYPGMAHGTNIFLTSMKPKIFQRIYNFIKKFNFYER